MQSDDLKQRGLWLLGLVACVVAFHQVASGYDDFLLPQTGVTFVPERELAFYAYFGLCGLCGLYCGTRLFGTLRATWTAERPKLWCAAIAVGVFLGSVLFRLFVIERQAIADDEATYVFIARTLLEGRLVNPVPQDAEFFRNQFVVLNEHGWYGKYPLGHPLVLALAELLHARDLVMPLLAAACVPLTYALGCRWFTPGRALAGTALLLVSPHFIGTAGTLLSQPTSCFVLLLGLWLLLRADKPALALLAGLAFGFGVLVRPLPGGLFAAVACMWALQRRGWLRGALALLGSGAGVIAVLAVNYAQTGSVLSSGYHEAHGSVVVFNNDHADIANSVLGALLRESFWLLGVPLALLGVWFARPQRWGPLFWGMLAAELAYRVISPKTVVASTGPIYLTEVVPLLLLAAADGVANARLRVLPVVAAGIVVAASMFWPVQWRTLRRASEARGMVYRALQRVDAEHALVFADALVHPSSVYTWAYFPDNPSPDLSDEILFLRLPKHSALEAHELWQRRFADRRAFVLTWNGPDDPAIEELSR